MLFKKKNNKSIQLDDESKLIYDILGDSEYKTFNRILLGLNYSSPGEYLRTNFEELQDILNCPAKLKESTFEKRFNMFRLLAVQNSFANIFGSLTVSDFEIHFPRINDKLQYELLNREFKNLSVSIEELESKVVKYENFCFYVEKNGGNNWNYLSHMKMLLHERKSTFLIESETKNEYYSNKKSVSKKYQFDIPSLRRFKDFSIILEKNDIIDSSEKLIALFIFPEKNLQDKIEWNRSNIALLFLVEFLNYHNEIIKPNNYLMSLSINFKSRDNGDLNNNSLGVILNKVGFTKEDFNPNVTKNQREDIIEIKKAYNRVYCG